VKKNPLKLAGSQSYSVCSHEDIMSDALLL
jgi:hypothetical protein